MTHASLFSGIGGFDLAAEQMGWENVFHVERDPFCQSVLKHHFPNSLPYGDITKFDATDFRGRVRVLSGGFPCQPFSAAGERKGDADDRHLWPEMLRVISEIMPTYVVAENVRGLLSWNNGVQFQAVQTDLGNLGYQVFPAVLPAAGVGAPHRRDRIFWICRLDAVITDYERDGCKPCHPGSADASNANALRLQQRTDSGEVGRGQSKVCEEGNQFAEPIKATRAAWDATNANDQECQRRSGASECERQEAEQRGHGVLGSVTRLSQESDATYSDGNGLQGGVPTNEHRQQPGTEESAEERVPYGSDARLPFQRFPTQPPVCGGDDGLPTELDGITFSKWRRESIKAYGNAVCVPLVKAIFEVIDNDCKQQ